MSMTRTLRAATVGVVCAAALLVAGPVSADVVPCDGAFVPDESSECLMDDSFVDDGFDQEPGIPAGFVVIFIFAAIAGVAITVWKVSTARDLARQAGMDPNVATGMTLLDDNGLSATYLASSLRTPMPERTSAPAPDPSPTVASRLTELAGLLQSGLITQAEHDERRAEIIDSV